MIDFWVKSGNTTLYSNWFGGVTEGALFKGGLYNDDKLREFLTQELADIEKMKRFVDVGLTDVNKGTYVDEYGSNLDSNLVDILFAEFSFAGFFAPA
jgi:hypothetical protein